MEPMILGIPAGAFVVLSVVVPTWLVYLGFESHILHQLFSRRTHTRVRRWAGVRIARRIEEAAPYGAASLRSRPAA